MVAETIVRPILPVVARGDFRKRFVGHDLALAEDRDPAIGLEHQRAFFADDHGVIRADLRGREAKRSERRKQGVVIVMHHEFFAHKLPAPSIRNGALVVRGVTRV